MVLGVGMGCVFFSGGIAMEACGDVVMNRLGVIAHEYHADWTV